MLIQTEKCTRWDLKATSWFDTVINAHVPACILLTQCFKDVLDVSNAT